MWYTKGVGVCLFSRDIIPESYDMKIIHRRIREVFPFTLICGVQHTLENENIHAGQSIPRRFHQLTVMENVSKRAAKLAEKIPAV